MFVKDRMTASPVTTTETTPILEAGEIFRKNNFARLPVVRDGKLVGIITQEDILKVSPSAATTLSVWELNYVLSKLQVKDAMTKNPFAIRPEATLEEAALLMREKEVGALPVVDGDRLVGIITESDIFDAFLDLMGLRQTGTRLTIDMEDRIGAIADLTEFLKTRGVSIISLALFHRTTEKGELVLRLDSPNTESLVEELKTKGYKISHVAKWN
ncbi:acetoin utilization protein AcuB [Hydrogenispora ethanolica]|uniref:Acetoin utilization protein AcuB n=1 Tax=Hydrogenispora ethanolica TaxID=1082276 RepID=A0A4R1SAH8_HYDET|nr:CBS and ACT domain-containing protein [Hydrogenispora ethanolica]TCL76526.1 acetoin utilization protein AcuB [Hydrogenispora ethanolica]